MMHFVAQRAATGKAAVGILNDSALQYCEENL